MRVLIITSQVTYIPGNQQQLFERLFDKAGQYISGVVVVKNTSLGLVGQTLWLYSVKCPRTASHTLKNIVSLVQRKKKALCKRRGIPLLEATSANDPKVTEWIKQNGIDVVVNIRTRSIYSQETLRAPRLGCVNIHHGILPSYRGVFCDLYALSEGRPAGFTIHKMDKKIDTGNILSIHHMSDNAEKNYMNYLKRTGTAEADALVKVLHDIDKLGKIPKGRPNVSSKIITSKTPTRHGIIQLRKKGMIL